MVHFTTARLHALRFVISTLVLSIFLGCTTTRVIETSMTEPGDATTSTIRPDQGKVDRVIILVFEQMRPDYIDRFDLKAFKKLRSESRNYPNALVGYIGAETVVSHLAITTGRKPSRLPWGDDVFFDRDGKIGQAGAFYATGGLSPESLNALMRDIPKKDFLATQLHKRFGGKVFSVAQKDYAAYTFGGPYADGVVTLSKKDGVCSVSGRNVPEYLTENSRFRLDCSDKYGTENTYYPLDGNRFVPGHDEGHLGGDVWVADAGIELMRQEDWSGLFLSFGAIDKVSHMLGEHEGDLLAKHQLEDSPEYDLAAVLKIADEQLARVLSELEKNNLRHRTLVVVTADHGGQANTHYQGNGKTAKFGAFENESEKEVPELVKAFSIPEHVAMSMQDSAIRVWLKTGHGHARPVIQALKNTPGVTAIYRAHGTLRGRWYHRVYRNWKDTTPAFRKWAKAHDQKLVNAVASRVSPDLVALLNDGYGFDLLGEHGGAQEKVQRVPLMIAHPQKKKSTLKRERALYDVKREIQRQLNW